MATDAPERLAGRLLDADAHLYLEPEVMEALLEPIGRDWVIEMLEEYKRSDTFPADKERGLDDVWGVKGLAAHGACEPEVRVETMDRMGIARQLAFPNTLGREAQHDTPEARQVLRNYNDYCLEWTRRTGGRSIGVCSLNLRSHEQAMVEDAGEYENRHGRPNEAPLPVVEMRGVTAWERQCERDTHQRDEEPVGAMRPVAPRDAQAVQGEARRNGGEHPALCDHQPDEEDSEPL